MQIIVYIKIVLGPLFLPKILWFNSKAGDRNFGDEFFDKNPPDSRRTSCLLQTPSEANTKYIARSSGFLCGLWNPPGGIPVQKGRGCLSYLLGVEKATLVRSCQGVQLHKFHSGNFCGPFQRIEPKKCDRRCVFLELISLRGPKNFKSCPQNTTLVPHRGAIQNF